MRCYNGCPDDELAAVWNSRAEARAHARRLGYFITYYPMEDKYAASKLGTYENIGPFCGSPEACIPHIEAHAREMAA